VKVRFWTSAAGRSPVEAWLQELPLTDRAKDLQLAIKRMEEI
jgi:hypothetical protein